MKSPTWATANVIEQEIYSRDRPSTWEGGPSPQSYEEAIFYVPTFFGASYHSQSRSCAPKADKHLFYGRFRNCHPGASHLGNGLLFAICFPRAVSLMVTRFFVAGRSKRCARSDVLNGGVDSLGGRFGSEVWCIRSHEWRCTVLNLGRLGRHFKHYA